MSQGLVRADPGSPYYPYKKSRFDPRALDDRYETLVKAKMEGRPIEPPKAPEPMPAGDPMEALRQSAGRKGSTPKRASRKTKPRRLARRRAA